MSDTQSDTQASSSLMDPETTSICAIGIERTEDPGVVRVLFMDGPEDNEREIAIAVGGIKEDDDVSDAALIRLAADLLGRESSISEFISEALDLHDEWHDEQD